MFSFLSRRNVVNKQRQVNNKENTKCQVQKGSQSKKQLKQKNIKERENYQYVEQKSQNIIKEIQNQDTIPCRICLEEDENNISGQLGNFCDCKGSISKVHAKCLEIQLQMIFKGESKMDKKFQDKCELCSTNYKLNIRKKIGFNNIRQILNKLSQKSKMLLFMAFITIISLHASYIISNDIQQRELNNKIYKDSVQMSLDNTIRFFFIAASITSIIWLTYNILIISLHFDIYISNKKQIKRFS